MSANFSKFAPSEKTTTRRWRLQLDPPAFCAKKQEARGLHSVNLVMLFLLASILVPWWVQFLRNQDRSKKKEHPKISPRKNPASEFQILECLGACRWGTDGAPHGEDIRRT
jgi:hypothetical protein